VSEDEPDWGTVVVPDDATELEADARALQRERAAARRRARFRRLTGSGRFHAHGITASVVAVAFVAILGFGGLLVLFGPHQARTPAAVSEPTPTASAGKPGGRLPSVPLRQDDGATVDASTLTTPAVLLLLPSGCDCLRTVQVAVDSSERLGLRPYVIEPATGGVTDAGGPDATRLTDDSGRLLAEYGSLGAGPTLLLVDDEGAVRTVQVGLTTPEAETLLASGVDS
jgi:hypothetical protein